MTSAQFISLLGERRAEVGWTQIELAERAGVSRQTLSAIEAGRQVPSTQLSLQLARALSCTVEELFRLARAEHISAELADSTSGTDEATAADSRRVALGKVGGRLVAHRLSGSAGDAADGVIAAQQPDSTAATIEPLVSRRALEQNVLVAGCAPLLGVLAGRLERRFRDARATWVYANSRRALDLLERGLVHVAGLHLVDEDLSSDNERLVRERFPGREMIIVNLTKWRQGLVVAQGNPLSIYGAEDLLRPSIRFAGREAGAGAHKLVDTMLRAAGAEAASMPTGPRAPDHSAVARLVRWGVADTGVAIEAAAVAEELDFLALVEERFDLVVPADIAEQAPVSRLLATLEETSFQADASHIPGYDLSMAGHASTIAPS